DGPLHDVPGLVPTDAEQPGAACDIGLEQDIDGVPLEGDREPGAGQGPGDVGTPDAMDGAIDPWDLRAEPRRAVAVIEMPPTPAGGMVVEWGPAAAHRAREESVATMDEPDVDGAFVGIEGGALDPPGLFQGQESCEQSDVSHSRVARGGDGSGMAEE